MSVAVYKGNSFVARWWNQKQLFKLKLNLYTGSVRLEGGAIKRVFSRDGKCLTGLFQFMRNEYGFTLGRILYKDRFYAEMANTTTSANEHYRFTVQDKLTLKVVVENEDFPAERFTAIVPKTDLLRNRISWSPSVLRRLFTGGITILLPELKNSLVRIWFCLYFFAGSFNPQMGAYQERQG